MTRFLVGALFDTYINLRYCIAEAGRHLNYMVDDALNAWGDDDDE